MFTSALPLLSTEFLILPALESLLLFFGWEFVAENFWIRGSLEWDLLFVLFAFSVSESLSFSSNKLLNVVAWVCQRYSWLSSYSIVLPRLRGPIPDPVLLRKSGSAGNQMCDLWICSQELRPLDHRFGPFAMNEIDYLNLMCWISYQRCHNHSCLNVYKKGVLIRSACLLNSNHKS
jgi:hypothetical protein